MSQEVIEYKTKLLARLKEKRLGLQEDFSEKPKSGQTEKACAHVLFTIDTVIEFIENEPTSEDEVSKKIQNMLRNEVEPEPVVA